MNPKHKKVFNIGFHKTGTTSLTQFMSDIGYKSLHSVALSMRYLQLGQQELCGEDSGKAENLELLIDRRMLHEAIQQYDFFSDNPWPLLYRYLDKTYPGSQFILTVRNNEKWINSIVKHSGTEKTRMRQIIYGYSNPTSHIAQYRKTYIRHNEKVQKYFKKKNNFLVIDIAEDDAILAEKITLFLGLRNPGAVFPAMNKMRS